MNELDLLIDLHKDAKRQGPGSEADTLKALSFISIKEKTNLAIADIGCGSGAQTITLAQQLNGHITAVDLFPAFLDRLNTNAQTLGLHHKISTLAKPMEDLPFENASFDLIWSEGAIYIIGFEAGIKKWKHFLKPGGYLAVSEITWLTNTRPKEIDAHWQKEYPEVNTASAKFKVLEENGFTPEGYFVLPTESWINNYYKPIEDRFEAFLQKHPDNPVAKEIVNAEKEEIRLYKQYKDYISYGFYIARKN